MFVNILLWVGIGTIGGLIAYFIYPTKREYLTGTIISGIVGAFFGGIFYSLLRIGTLAVAIDPVASLMALLSMVAILNLIKRAMKTEEEFLVEDNRNIKLP